MNGKTDITASQSRASRGRSRPVGRRVSPSHTETPRRQGGHVSEMQRRRLLLAIGEVVAESGLEAATVGRVCEQAGVSRRTFYELFKDREACLLSAFDTAVERMARSVLPVLEGSGSWRERIHKALAAVLEHLDTEPDVARLCVIETPRAGQELLERRKEVLSAIAAAVDRGRSETRKGEDPPPLTAQGVVGGALSVIHAHLLASPPEASGDVEMQTPGDGGAPSSLVELTGPLMAMIVHPYLGSSAARNELRNPAPTTPPRTPRGRADPFKGLPIRFTYRTALVLATIASNPGASNRHIANHAGIVDEGQISRLLQRLNGCELIENRSKGQPHGEPNAWTLTERGETIHTAITTSPA